MFSSRTLEERNNDPKPFEDVITGERWWKATPAPGTFDLHAPRPEFQYGKLPANPILVEFRNEVMAHIGSPSHTTHNLARGYLGDAPTWAFMLRRTEYSASEKAHAHRVLSLLATLEPVTA